jgi:glycosyltransferase involved in cell wall biosynthesis
MKEARPKVLFISSRADIGGGPKHLLDLLSSDSYKNIEIFVAIPEGFELSKSIIRKASAFIPIPHRQFNIFTFLKLRLFCLQHSIDLIHSHGRGGGMYSRLLSLWGVQVIHTFHGIHHEKSFIGTLKLQIDKFLKNLASVYICVSPDEFSTAKDHGVCQDARVIPNGVSHPNTNPYLPSEGLTVGLLARLSFQKGVDILISHIKENPFSNCKFLVAGSGEMEEELKSDARSVENLEFVGKTLDPTGFLSSLDIFVSSSRWEGFPLSVLEAMAQGLPCLLPRVTGHGIFEEEEAALFYELHSAKDFSEKLSLLLEDKTLRKKLSNKGFDLISTKLNKEEMAKKTIAVYQKLL